MLEEPTPHSIQKQEGKEEDPPNDSWKVEGEPGQEAANAYEW